MDRPSHKPGWVVAACLLALPFAASCRRGPSGQEPVEILVIDSFVLSEHGRTVRDIAEQWSLGACAVREYDVEPAAPDGYLKALRQVAERVSNGPDARFVINISLASPTPSAEEERLLDELAERGAIVVVASGNHGREEALYPAAYDSVIAVAASGSGRKRPYSNYGPHVDLAVDTRDVRRTVEAFQLPAGLVMREIVESGTSQSAPKLCGLLGLLWSGEPNRTRRQVLATLRSCCRPMRDLSFRRGMLGAGELDDLRMVWLSRSGRLRAILVIGTSGLLAALFVWRAWGLVSGAFFALVACAVQVMICTVLDLPWALRWGPLAGLAAFPAVFGLYRRVAPLRGLRVRVWAGKGCGTMRRNLRRRLRKLGACTGPGDEPEDEAAALPAEQLELLVSLGRLANGLLLCRCRWTGPLDGLPPPPETREFPARSCVRRAATLVQRLAYRPPKVSQLTDEDVLMGDP